MRTGAQMQLQACTKWPQMRKHDILPAMICCARMHTAAATQHAMQLLKPAGKYACGAFEQRERRVTKLGSTA